MFTETNEEHTKAVKVLDSTCVEFHTYSPKGEAQKYRRFLIHGFDPESPADEVPAELKERLGEGFVKAHSINRTNQDKDGLNLPNYRSLRNPSKCQKPEDNRLHQDRGH